MISKERKKKIKDYTHKIQIKIAQLNDQEVDYLSCYTYDERCKDGGELQRMVEDLRKSLYEAESITFKLSKIVE